MIYRPSDDELCLRFAEAWVNGSWNVGAAGRCEAAWFAAENHFLLPSIPVDIIPQTDLHAVNRLGR